MRNCRSLDYSYTHAKQPANHDLKSRYRPMIFSINIVKIGLQY